MPIHSRSLLQLFVFVRLASRRHSSVFAFAVKPIAVDATAFQCLDQDKWRGEAKAHRDRIDRLLGGSLSSGNHDKSHPIYNFLFKYYFYKPTHVASYSPGFGHIMLNAQDDEVAGRGRGKQRRATRDPVTQGLYFGRCNPNTLQGLISAHDLLVATHSRPPVLNCFGLHEWAMLYAPAWDDTSTVQRHQEHLPTRLSQEEINEVVETRAPLRCTHVDAFRFFTEAAQPLNQYTMNRESQSAVEQPGCVHANMDLFKWAMKLHPWVDSETVGDCFELARDARILDMRASPYDLTAVPAASNLDFDASPICVETREGRQRYQVEQEILWHRSRPLRQKLIESYAAFIDYCTLDDV